jgi:hypothetical protein
MASQRKTHVLRAAHSGTQFIQLAVRELEVGEDALMQGLCMQGLRE